MAVDVTAEVQDAGTVEAAGRHERVVYWSHCIFVSLLVYLSTALVIDRIR